jgi:FKBP-type peptidyl-prolyl cis-trans isomerase
VEETVVARKRERAFALFGAGLFLLTSSALTIAVIYSMTQQNKKQDSGATSQAATDATKKSEAKVDNTAKTGVLQGTALTGFTPIASIPELKEIDTTEGTGAAVKSTDTVTVDYTGAVAATGIIFQSSLDAKQTATFPLSGVIKGWTDGVPGMKIGGTRRLLIPAAQAYGANPPSGSGIPANADLVFDITLHAIK